MINEDDMELALEIAHNRRLKQEDRDYKNLLDNELPEEFKINVEVQDGRQSRE